MWKQAPKMLEVLGRRFGEYPFLRDKYWVAETPYLGMEHQTIVAYGADFKDNEYGFDCLLLHETAHEWWGNKITAADWGDFWIHEGFGTYAEALFVNDTLGVDKYLEYMRRPSQHLGNRKPIVQGRELTAGAAYIGDIYGKGALVLHTLRYLVGDDAFFAHPPRFATDERYAYRLASRPRTSTRLVAARARASDPLVLAALPLYGRAADLPRDTRGRCNGRIAGSRGERQGRTRRIEWSDQAFEMPLPVASATRSAASRWSAAGRELDVATGTAVEVDPQGWVLAKAGMSSR